MQSAAARSTGWVIQDRDIEVAIPVSATQAGGGQQSAGHVFISYVREDSDHIDRLQHAPQAARILVSRDTADLWPG
jgi:TIR domain